MKNHKSQNGFSIIEIVVVIVALALGVTIGIVGMNAYNNSIKKTPAAEVTPKATDNTATDVPIAPVIDTVQSLDTATQTLDSINLDSDSGDSTKLDTQTADF